MTVTSVENDPNALTLTVTAEFAAEVKRVWELWADPRKLERWWGPPGYPATFTEHDLAPGTRTKYFMTSPEGERFYGTWRILSIDEPNRIEIEDAFADEHGEVDPDQPVGRMEVTLSGRSDGGTQMVITSTHASAADLQKVLDMGMEEGIRQSVGQMDALLA
jgi:uncharacterized protein YndB with AHSA1/START domain